LRHDPEISRYAIGVPPWPSATHRIRVCQRPELVIEPIAPGIAVVVSIIDLDEPNIDGLEPGTEPGIASDVVMPDPTVLDPCIDMDDDIGDDIADGMADEMVEDIANDTGGISEFGTADNVPNSPCASFCTPAVKKILFGSLAPPLPGISAHRSPIVTGAPFGASSLPKN
jgi:hypothetical protein